MVQRRDRSGQWLWVATGMTVLTGAGLASWALWERESGSTVPDPSRIVAAIPSVEGAEDVPPAPATGAGAVGLADQASGEAPISERGTPEADAVRPPESAVDQAASGAEAPPEDGEVTATAKDTAPADPVPDVAAATQAQPEEPPTEPAPSQATTAPDIPPPGFDLVRVDAQGGALIAGTAPPLWTVAVEVDGTEAASSRSDRAGSFAALFDLVPSPEARVIFLVARGPEGEELRSTSSVIIAPRPPEALASAPGLNDPETARGEALALAQPGAATPPEVRRSGPDGPRIAEAGALPSVGGPGAPPPESELPEAAVPDAAEVAVADDVQEARLREVADAQDGPKGNGALASADAGFATEIPEVVPGASAGTGDALSGPETETETISSRVVTAITGTEEAARTETVLAESGTEGLVPETPTSPGAIAGEAVDPDSAPRRSASLTAEPVGSATPPGQLRGDPAREAQTEIASTGAAAAVTEPRQPDEAVAPSTGAPARLAASTPPDTLNPTPERLASAPPTADSLTPSGGTTSSQVSSAESATPTTAAPARAPSVLLSDASGVRLFQPSRTSPASGDRVAIEVISYDDAGGVLLEGRSKKPPPVAREVQVYLDNAPVQRVQIAEDGSWRTPLSRVASGVYTLRVDQIDVTGQVISRFETPFKREDPGDLASLADTVPGEVSASVITVQPGYTLWGIASDRYGSGVNYVQIFEANRAQIRDPDLIYPGQVFDLPADPG